jgi:transposase
MLVFEKFGQHQPLNRQAERYARERVPWAIHPGRPGGRLHHGADAAVRSAVDPRDGWNGCIATTPRCRSWPKARRTLHRAWVYVRDHRPFGGMALPAALFYYSRDRSGEHPQAHLARYAGILQADAYGGYGKLYAAGRSHGMILEAGCWAHARRKFFVLSDVNSAARRKAQGKQQAVMSPLCLEAVQRIERLFDIERDINRCRREQRRNVRQELSAPLVADLHSWMIVQRRTLSGGNDVAKAIDHILKRWAVFARFLVDGRICLTNNAAERGLRSIALGRKSLAIRRIRSRRASRRDNV